MSSILGIKSNSGEEGIVIASDIQTSIYDGDTFVRKGTTDKIWYGDTWALAHCGGTESEELKRFHRILQGDKRYKSSPEKVKEIIGRAINSSPRRLIEINELNAALDLRGEGDNTIEFLFAISEPRLEIWQVSQFGWLKTYLQIAEEEGEDREFEYLTIGSGEEYIRNYIKSRIEDDNNPLNPEDITISTAVRISRPAVKKAYRDPNTTAIPLDLVVLTKRGVKRYGPEIKRQIEEAEVRSIEEIAEEYKQQ